MNNKWTGAHTAVVMYAVQSTGAAAEARGRRVGMVCVCCSSAVGECAMLWRLGTVAFCGGEAEACACCPVLAPSQ